MKERIERPTKPVAEEALAEVVDDADADTEEVVPAGEAASYPLGHKAALVSLLLRRVGHDK